jgi:uncharacterized membrane protein YfcA
MLPIDWSVALAGLLVGGVVGLTGMGGGALMTPILVLLFGIPAHVAVASDLAASLFMKPLGAWVHLRQGTVNGRLVRYLVLGSVPAAFLGAALVSRLGTGEDVNAAVKRLLGGTLLVAAAAMLAKAALKKRHPVTPGASDVPIALKPLRTAAIGVVGGFIVGMTSVGSGSLVIVMLMLLYPRLSGSRLVGTDLAQAIPLVGSAALGHFVFGEVKLELTASLLIGSIPGVYLGALYSARASDRLIRPVLVLVLVASALKLLGASNDLVLLVVGMLGAGALVHLVRTRPAPEPALAEAAPADGLPAE